MALRRRVLAYLEGLDECGWGAPTRCSAWSVHHVARHMVDAARINAALLAGRPPVFVSDRPFDPTRTPDVWLRSSADQSPRETVAAMAAAAADETDSFRTRIRRADSPRLVEAATGRQVHWSNVPLHILWDAWLHERDVLLPAGGAQDSCGEELRLVAMYALQLAAIPPLLAGSPLDTTIALDGAPDRRYKVGAPLGEVVVAAEDIDDAALWGHVSLVVDALMGRGHPLLDVLNGNRADAHKLSWLSAFMTAENR